MKTNEKKKDFLDTETGRRVAYVVALLMVLVGVASCYGVLYLLLSWFGPQHP